MDERETLKQIAKLGGFNESIIPADVGHQRALLQELQEISKMGPKAAHELTQALLEQACKPGVDGHTRGMLNAKRLFARNIAMGAEGEAVHANFASTQNLVGQQPLRTDGTPGPAPATVVGHSTRAKTYAKVATAEELRDAGGGEYARIDALDIAVRALTRQVQSPARSYTEADRSADQATLESLDAERDALAAQLKRRGDWAPKRQRY